MSYYQNVFPTEFIGNWVLGDRQASLSFRCPANVGRGDEIVQSYGVPTGANGTFNLSGNDLDGNSKANLIIWYARDYSTGFKGWTSLTIDVHGAVAATTSATEIVTALNADSTFKTMFVASIASSNNVIIRQLIPAVNFKFYIDNHAAETVLRFNAKAGISQLPSYFNRHTISNRFNFTDGCNQLIQLTHVITGITLANPAVATTDIHGLATGKHIAIANTNSGVVLDTADVAVTIPGASTTTFSTAVDNSGGSAGDYGVWARLVDLDIITNAVDKNGNTLGYTLASTQRDYDLLAGRAGIFNFQKVTVDAIGTGRITKIIEYPAGSTAGSMARLIKYSYTTTKTSPDVITEEPYVLTAADLVVPPVV